MTENPRSCWRTPRWLFNLLNSEFWFTLDGAADEHNALCARFCSRAEDAFSADWSGEVVFVNPPYSGARYGERSIREWVGMCADQAQRGATVVALLPCDTGTEWFWLATCRAVEIRLVQPRIEFDPPYNGGIRVSGNRGPSCVVIFRYRTVANQAHIAAWPVDTYRDRAVMESADV